MPRVRSHGADSHRGDRTLEQARGHRAIPGEIPGLTDRHRARLCGERIIALLGGLFLLRGLQVRVLLGSPTKTPINNGFFALSPAANFTLCLGFFENRRDNSGPSGTKITGAIAQGETADHGAAYFQLQDGQRRSTNSGEGRPRGSLTPSRRPFDRARLCPFAPGVPIWKGSLCRIGPRHVAACHIFSRQRGCSGSWAIHRGKPQTGSPTRASFLRAVQADI